MADPHYAALDEAVDDIARALAPHPPLDVCQRVDIRHVLERFARQWHAMTPDPWA